MSGTILVTGGTIGDFVVDGLTKKGQRTLLHNPSTHVFHAELFRLRRFNQEARKILRSPGRFQNVAGGRA